MGLDINLYVYKDNPNLLENFKSSPSESIYFDSKVYPKNICKIGYFRSSYNSSGFDSIIPLIFGVGGFEHLFAFHEYNKDGNFYFQTNWKLVKERSEDLLNQYIQYLDQNDGLFNIMFEGPNPYKNLQTLQAEVPDSEHAMNLFMKQKNEKTDAFGGGYSNNIGVFSFNNPYSVYGVIPGFKYGQVGVYIIYKIDRKSAEYYQQMIEILIESCDYVMNLPDRNHVWVSWSG